MKHFKLIGPNTTREFDIEDDQMINIEVMTMKPIQLQNETFYDTVEDEKK